MDVISNNLQKTYALAKEVVTRIKKKEGDGATVVALYGELGGGKTSFVQGAARALGITGTIISPTYVIFKSYDIPRERDTEETRWKTLIHADCYRINEPKEIKTLGWGELLARKENIIFVEWADRIESVLPSDAAKLYFEIRSEEMRAIRAENLS